MTRLPLNNAAKKFQIRRAVETDLASIIAVKEALAVERSTDVAAREGFLLGSSPEYYRQMITHGIAHVIESCKDLSLKGVGFALPWQMLQETEVWQKRSSAKWYRPILTEIEQGRPGYIEQLAVVPGQTIRFLAPGLGLALVEELFASGHTHLLTTTVVEPIRNQAALKLLALIQAEAVGEIVEQYPRIGTILSQIHCVSLDTYRDSRNLQSWRGKVLSYLEKTAIDRRGWCRDAN